MLDIKDSFRGGLDLDTSFYKVKKNSYIDALNITRDAVVSGQDDVVSNIIGNQLFDYTLPAGTNISIGAYANTLANTVISFVYNSNGNHSIVEYDFTAQSSAKIFESKTDSGSTDILNFTSTGKITGINVYPSDEGDLLFFVDSLGRPSALNITRFKAGQYTPVTRDIINLAKRPPLSPPTAGYSNDAARTSNNFIKKLTRYRYRWIYDDDYKSTASPICVLPLPTKILDPTYTNIITNNNVVNISMNSGPQNVKKVELWLSISENSNQFDRFVLAQTIDKTEQSIADDTDFTISFYNDSTYPFISDQENLLLFDYIPDSAVAQEMLNGNVIALGNLTEGYDRDLDANVTLTLSTVTAGSTVLSGTLSGITTILLENGSLQIFRITFSGVPAAGVLVEVKVQRVGDSAIFTAASYTTVTGDTLTSVTSAINTSFNSLGQVSTSVITGGSEVTVVTNTIMQPKRIFYSLSISLPALSLSNSFPSWKWSTSRNIGIAYYDLNGKTNGILYNDKVIFPPYAENGSQVPLLPYINIKIYHAPPDWAYSYQICFTKEPTQYLFFETIDVLDDTNYLYFDITNLGLNQKKNPTTATVISWSFQDGDRMRLIRDRNGNTVYGATFDTFIEGIVVSPVVNNSTRTDKTFVKIKKASPFSGVSYGNKYFVIELYRPGQQPPNNENDVYYECGIEYPILNPTEATRVHAGQVTNQSTDLSVPAEINIYQGDSYYRSRTLYLTDTFQQSINVQDRNFVDFYVSAVSSIDGRALAIEINAKEATYEAMIRHSEAYQPNTNVNGLNRFYPNNFLDCDNSYGGIMRLSGRDRLMKVFQENKIGRIPLFSQIGKSATGDEITITTDRLLNPIQYYVGNWGIGTAGTSLASFNYADYFVDNYRGAICRSSHDGINVLSILYKTNSWAAAELPLRKGNYFVYGAFDQKLNNYIVALEAAGSSSAQTIVFSEGWDTDYLPTFESFISLYPEMMVTLGTMLCSFKNGALWTHDSDIYNSFFGTSYESSITEVFNDNMIEGKTFEAVETMSNTKWDCPEIISQVNTYGTTPQQTNLKEAEFELLEGKYVASIKRDANSSGGKINGDVMKGSWVKIKFRKQTASNLVTLNLISVRYVDSPLTSKIKN